MSFFKPCSFALLCAVMLAPACAKKLETAASTAVASAATEATTEACDGALFNSQCVHKGDIVTFGTYPQATETPEPIEWIVLEVQSNNGDTPHGRLLLLSQYVIDFRAYQPNGSDYPTWAKSDIRTWLNDTGKSGFLSAAFSAKELSEIVEVTNTTSDYDSDDDEEYTGGEPSNDRVFLLDWADAENTAYFANDDARKAKATTYAMRGKGRYFVDTNEGTTGSDGKKTCANIQCTALWWLRSPGDFYFASGVFYNGDVDGDGDFAVETIAGVRPALWVKY